MFPRSSGILLHPTSLPGRYGIGDLGDWAYRFVDRLEAAGQTLWQILPLGPTSYGDSPYQTLSAFAGNPILISLDRLVAEGWLTPADVEVVPEFSDYRVNYGDVITYHNHMLGLAFHNFRMKADSSTKWVFQNWCETQKDWLDPYALFATLKELNNLRPWTEWPAKQAAADPAAIAELRQTNAQEIESQKWRQWVFHMQWMELKQYANKKGIRLVGDIPIFVAHDSGDVWGNRHLFFLQPDGNPTVIAGVPPDYFSATGQRWGNPLYRWDVMAAEGYKWWLARIKATLETVDIVRIDHFRGFEAYWEIPAAEETAVNGKWVKGPGTAFFDVVKAALGELPIIAEDLGVITPEVAALRDGYNLPGMKVLQFAFGWDPYGENAFLPHNHTTNCVVYTGTHDNNTTLGWWQTGEVSDDARNLIEAYLGHPVREPHWDLIRLGMTSVAHTFITPLQDVLGFGADTRMNTPGKPAGNWAWRFAAKWLDHNGWERLAAYTKLAGRWPEAKREAQ